MSKSAYSPPPREAAEEDVRLRYPPGAIANTFVRFSRLVAGVAAPGRVLSVLAGALVDQLGARAAAVFQVEDTSGRARLVAVRNIPESLLGREVEPEAIDPPVVEAILSPRPGERLLTFPLASSGSLFGVAIVAFDESAPSAVWDELAPALVDLAAIALEKDFHDVERGRAAKVEREEGEQRFLAEAGAVLGSSLDERETLEALARLVVRWRAHLCVIDLLDESGALSRREAAHADPALAEVTRAIAARPPDPAKPHFPLAVVRSRQPLLVAEVPAGHLETIAADEEHLRLLRALDPRSLIVVPLLARGQVLGTICLVSGPGGPRYGEADLRVAADLGQRAALAIENARLYAAAQRATRARDEVLGIVAHDLRNPLASILLCVKSLRRGLTHAEAEAGRGKTFDLVVESGERMNGLIEDLLDVTRLEAGRLPLARAALKPAQVLADAAAANRTLAEERGLTLETSAPDDAPAVLADRRRVQQVLANLVGNALKFTPRGGVIRLGAGPAPGAVRFTVADTGAGIAREHLPRLFDRFYQADPKDRRGAGLGLAIVKGLVEAHGGQLAVESVIGEGTTVAFTLPVA